MVQTKRLILTIVGSNLRLIDGKLSIDAAKPFRHWAETENISDMLAFVKDVRTLALHQDAAFATIAALEEHIAEDDKKLVAA